MAESKNPITNNTGCTMVINLPSPVTINPSGTVTVIGMDDNPSVTLDCNAGNYNFVYHTGAFEASDSYTATVDANYDTLTFADTTNPGTGSVIYQKA